MPSRLKKDKVKKNISQFSDAVTQFCEIFSEVEFNFNLFTTYFSRYSLKHSYKFSIPWTTRSDGNCFSYSCVFFLTIDAQTPGRKFKIPLNNHQDQTWGSMDLLFLNYVSCP